LGEAYGHQQLEAALRKGVIGVGPNVVTRMSESLERVRRVQ